MAGTCAGSWEPSSGVYPYPPANVIISHSFLAGCLDIRWDDPSALNLGPSFTTVQATGTLLVSGTPDVTTTATGTITVAGVPIPPGSGITIGGQPLLSVAAVRTPGQNNFNGSLATADLVAAEIADAINDFNNGFRQLVTAVAVGNIVTLTSLRAGIEGNATSLGSSTATLVVPAALSGGLNGGLVIIGGWVLAATSGPRTSGSNNFSVVGSNFDIAQSIADAINDPANRFTPYVTASADSGLVTLTGVPVGVNGNSIPIGTTASVITVSGSYLTGGVGLIACTGASNSQWNILGVNVYRSDTGERGPYFRVNKFPVGSGFFRDCTDNMLITEEVIPWETGWVDRGDAANNRIWKFRTRYRPVVKREGQAIAADSPSDVVVSIDGFVVPVNRVFGPSGEVTLINQATYDPSTERTIPPLLPNPDGSSVVLVTYYRQNNLVKTSLETKAKIHYRLTTVAVDPTGTTPSGLVETPLGFTPPVSPIQTEQLDYIWREAIRRNRWVLEQGGERVKLFIRRVTGIRCPCEWDPELFEYTQQPLNNCTLCYGTGYVGGFEGPIDLIIAPEDAERAVRQTMQGRRLEQTYEVWTGPTPLLSQRDFIVKLNGERFSIGPVRRTQVRGVVLQQSFNLGYLDECDIRYQVPIVGQFLWPETRYTRPEEAPCVPADPYPIGYDYQAQPMGTEVGKIPDAREQRGRTPVWANITYGGKGGT